MKTRSGLHSRLVTRSPPRSPRPPDHAIGSTIAAASKPLPETPRGRDRECGSLQPVTRPDRGPRLAAEAQEGAARTPDEWKSGILSYRRWVPALKSEARGRSARSPIRPTSTRPRRCHLGSCRLERPTNLPEGCQRPMYRRVSVRASLCLKTVSAESGILRSLVPGYHPASLSTEGPVLVDLAVGPAERTEGSSTTSSCVHPAASRARGSNRVLGRS
jgi:hypothetical protein